jgi:probable HAF family extracellular repeat protein
MLKTLLTILAVSIPLAAQPKYVPVDLGTLGGNGTAPNNFGSRDQANGINNLGQVTGTSATAAGYPHAFRTAPNAAIQPATDDLGTLGGTNSSGSAINDAGQVAGTSQTGAAGPFGSIVSRAYRADPGQPMIDLGTLSFIGGVNGFNTSVGNGINNLGQVVGAATVPFVCVAVSHAFRTGANAAIVPLSDGLGTLIGGCRSSTAFGVNNLGMTVGYSATTVASGIPDHAFAVVGNGLMQDLGTLPGGIYSRASAVNDLGQIVGESGITPEAFPITKRAFLKTSVFSAMQDIGTLGGSTGFASDINNASLIVGASSTTNDAAIHGFLYNVNTNMMYDLNNLIPAGQGWELFSATGINEAGQIVGGGIHNGQYRAYRLDPADVAVGIVMSQIADPALGLSAAAQASLSVKLQAALDSMTAGNLTAAANQLNAFTNQVNALLNSGRISEANAAALIAAADAIVASL